MPASASDEAHQLEERAAVCRPSHSAAVARETRGGVVPRMLRSRPALRGSASTRARALPPTSAARAGRDGGADFVEFGKSVLMFTVLYAPAFHCGTSNKLVIVRRCARGSPDQLPPEFQTILRAVPPSALSGAALTPASSLASRL